MVGRASRARWGWQRASRGRLGPMQHKARTEHYRGLNSDSIVTLHPSPCTSATQKSHSSSEVRGELVVLLHHKREIEASLVPRADISWRSFAVTLLWYHAAIAQTQPRARSQLLTDHAHPSTQQRQAGHADIMRCLIPSISTDGRAFAMVSRTLQRSHLRFSPPWRHGGGF